MQLRALTQNTGGWGSKKQTLYFIFTLYLQQNRRGLTPTKRKQKENPKNIATIFKWFKTPWIQMVKSQQLCAFSKILNILIH